MSTFTDPLARWNERFSVEGYLFGEAPNAYLKQKTALLHRGKTLSIADGEGRNSVWLAQQGLEVDAFDFSPIAIDKARKLAAQSKVSVNYQCCDWAAFDWPTAYYDNVVGIFFQFVEPASRDALFAKMDQALKPGGILLIHGYNKEQLQFNTGGPGRLDHLYDQALLESAFPNYKIIEGVSYKAEVQEGAGHSGLSALLGFVAQKN